MILMIFMIWMILTMSRIHLRSEHFKFSNYYNKSDLSYSNNLKYCILTWSHHYNMIPHLHIMIPHCSNMIPHHYNMIPHCYYMITHMSPSGSIKLLPYSVKYSSWSLSSKLKTVINEKNMLWILHSIWWS